MSDRTFLKFAVPAFFIFLVPAMFAVPNGPFKLPTALGLSVVVSCLVGFGCSRIARGLDNSPGRRDRD